MVGTSSALLAAVGGLLLGGVTAAGRELASTQTVEKAQQPAAVTGCLAKGKDKDSFTLKGTDGKSYSLTSSTVKLGEHVGHTVAVTGAPAAVETGALKDTSAKKEANAQKGMPAPSGNAISVTSLKMVSTQCK
jgi:hypothetical protein